MYGFHNAWDGTYMMGGWYGWLSVLGSVIFWVALVVAAVFIFRYFRDSGAFGRNESALDILEKRYAKGEIDKAEFETKKEELKR